MSNLTAGAHETASLEWPPAVQAALAAALDYLLPKAQPVLELRPRPDQMDQSPAIGSIGRLLEQRGSTLFGGELRLPPSIPNPTQKDKSFVLPFASSSVGSVYAI